MAKYDHKEIESKWQKSWEDENLFKTKETAEKGNVYVLDMFPYPSGKGLHVGHPLGYIASDIFARKKRMEGMSVLHPMGWDAFGLPAENYAIKTGVHPEESTLKNIETFRGQFKMFANSYDWSREINTSSPDYYRWTQWMFLMLYKRGLAYKQTAPVNWCEKDNTVLANEQVVNGECDRCGNPVVQKELSQWFFKITDFADRLTDDLEKVDWPEKIKAMQRNWIGRSEGAEIVFKGVSEHGEEFDVPVFTTRPDTLFGVSYVVLAPEHPLVKSITQETHRADVDAYCAEAKKKSELERTSDHVKTGVPIGAQVTHPLTGLHVPVWIADYALATYGTGAVMGVPAHDDRDYEFATKYELPITHVVKPSDGETPEGEAFTGSGVMQNSGAYDGEDSLAAKTSIAEELKEKGLGGQTINYRIRDWLISRQRYWGTPIPIIYCDDCGEVPVPEEQLPVMLPTDVDFMPTGESPLTKSESFHNVECPQCGKKARRESDTMDTFVDSSWYFLRYPDPYEENAPFNREAVEKWLPVDTYVGGAEHAVMHLLYARFFTKALHDADLLGFDEPFTRLLNQGMILGENGEKMSKSKGNVVNPDDVIKEYGADTLRLYEMFMGEFTESKPWDTKGIIGTRRFLDKVWTAVHDSVHEGREEVSEDLDRILHKTIKKVSEDIEAFKFNTAIAQMMILMNEWQKLGGGSKEFMETFTRLLAPFAVHISEELWSVLGHEDSVHLAEWPSFDATKIIDSRVTVVVQVNGKLRGKLDVAAGLSQEKVEELALADEKVKDAVADKEIKKIIVIQDKLVNIVVT